VLKEALEIEKATLMASSSASMRPISFAKESSASPERWKSFAFACLSMSIFDYNPCGEKKQFVVNLNFSKNGAQAKLNAKSFATLCNF
jgi:hypothetical protein